MELGVLINQFADSIGSRQGIATVLDNPIYTALVITFVIMIIFYFSESTRKQSSGNRFRVSFYIFAALLTIMFVYHRRFQKCQAQQSKISEIQSALATPLVIPSTELVSVIPPVYMNQ